MEKVMKSLRELILSETSFTDPLQSSTLFHGEFDVINLLSNCYLKKFIVAEKTMAQKSFDSKREDKKRENSKDEDLKKDNSHDALSSSSSNEAVLIAKQAIEQWEQSASSLISLVKEGKGQEVLESLLAASKLDSVCKRAIIFCVVILIKKSEDLNLITKCYSALPQIVKSSHLFFLFIELCKIFTTARMKNSGWGRGMKRAIRNWYLQWEPKLLALEVIRCSSAYTWSHKDVLKMAHISLKDLPTEMKLILNFIFSGLENTKQKYGSEENAHDMIQLLEMLQKGVNVMNADILVKRASNILDQFGSISLQDFPTQAFNDPKVIAFILKNGGPQLIIEALVTTQMFRIISSDQKLRDLLRKQLEREGFHSDIDLFQAILAYNNCCRILSHKLHPSEVKQWMKFANPNPDKMKSLKKSESCSKKDHLIPNTLGKLITEGSMDVKMTRIVAFVCLEPSMDEFLGTLSKGFSTKKVRGMQAISFFILALASSPSSLESVVPMLAAKVKKTGDSNIPSTFTSLHTVLSKLANTGMVSVDIEESLKIAVESKVLTCIFMYFSFSKYVEHIYNKFKDLKTKNPESDLRVVIYQLVAGEVEFKNKYQHPDLLLLSGFNSSTLAIIQAFHSRMF